MTGGAPRDGMALGPGGEFDAIRAMLARWGARARGIGDDAAVLDVPPGERLVVSNDSAVEHVHFRREWLSPREIGYRAAAAALSDLAAMGAMPLGMLVALSVPESWRDALDGLADGLGEVAERYAIPIVGGNLSRGAELSIATTVLGSARRPIARRGAQVGDAVFVTGMLGGAAAALRELERRGTPTAGSLKRFTAPEPRLREGRWLAEHGAHAMLDISDGLAADAGHLAAASAVRVRLELDRVPVAPGVDPFEAAASGEEYELLVAAPPSLDVAAFARELGVPLTRIGDVVPGAAGVEATLGGARVALPGGHDHFSR